MKDVYEEAFKRRHDKCDIPLEQVFVELNFKEIATILEKDE